MSDGAAAASVRTAVFLSTFSRPSFAHAVTSEVVVTGAGGELFPSTKRLPSARSSRASTMRVAERLAHAGSVENSAGLAIDLYWSGTSSGFTAEGGEQPARITSARRMGVRFIFPPIGNGETLTRHWSYDRRTSKEEFVQ